MASGDPLARWWADEADGPATNFASLGTRGTRYVLEFDTTTQETAYFNDVMPNYYGGGSITINIWVAAATATAGNIGFLVAFERIGTVQDLDVDGFAATQTVAAVTVNATAGIPSKLTLTVTNAQADAIAAEEPFRVSIARNVAVDTAAGDAHLLAVFLEEA